MTRSVTSGGRRPVNLNLSTQEPDMGCEHRPQFFRPVFRAGTSFQSLGIGVLGGAKLGNLDLDGPGSCSLF